MEKNDCIVKPENQKTSGSFYQPTAIVFLKLRGLSNNLGSWKINTGDVLDQKKLKR